MHLPLYSAIRTIHAGRTYFHASIAERFKRSSLSERELEALLQMALGQTNNASR